MVDGQRREGPHLGPAVLTVASDPERAAPDGLRVLEPVARPRDPPGEKQGAGDRPRLAEPLGSRDRPGEELFARLEVGVDVDREVAAEAESERERPVVLERRPELDRPLERLDGGGIFGEPVARFSDPGERACLTNAPRVLGSGQRERPGVEVERGATLHPPTRPIAGRE